MITQWPLHWETWILLLKFSHMKKIRGLSEMTLILSRYKLPSLDDMAGETKVGRDLAQAAAAGWWQAGSAPGGPGGGGTP